MANPISSEYMDRNLERTLRKSTEIRDDVAKLIAVALEQEDALTRFLLAFFAVEIAIEKTFEKSKKRRTPEVDRRIQSIGDKRLKILAEEVAEGKNKNGKKLEPSLKTNFIWCYLHIWQHLTPSDLSNFEKIRTVRNEIVHRGKIELEQTRNAGLAENLAVRLNMDTL